MLKIMFSIPIHEKLEVVLDQVRNFNFFNPDCGIVLHFSESFDYANSSITREEFEKEVGEIGNIFLNPISVRTAWCDIIQAHLLNFSYVSQKCEFEYFALCASNEMFIKKGLYQWIKEYDCGLSARVINEETEWFHGKMALKDKALKKILQDIGGEDITASQMEGSFFKRGLFQDVCEVINRNYDYKSMETPYAREEIYFSTIITNWESGGRDIRIYINGMFTYMPWEIVLKIRISDIKRLREQNAQFFSVKRIERDIDDKVRNYIREEIGKGYLDSRSRLLKLYNSSETALDGIQSILSFDGGGISGLLQDTIECLELAREHGLKEASSDIVSLLENEYADEVLDGILQGGGFKHAKMPGSDKRYYIWQRCGLYVQAASLDDAVCI